MQLVSNFAFDFNLRRYGEEAILYRTMQDLIMPKLVYLVGRCRLNR